jgi:hypothetical protein
VAAVLAVLVTTAVAVAVMRRDEGPTLAVVDPSTGASLRVPADEWHVRGELSRIAYTMANDDRVVAWGPAVFREGYCTGNPGSFRAFAGFTREEFGDWVDGVTGEGRMHLVEPGSGIGEAVDLDDGTAATLTWSVVEPEPGPCPAPRAEIAMVTAGGVNAVVVADTGGPGLLSREDMERILLTLELP